MPTGHQDEPFYRILVSPFKIWHFLLTIYFYKQVDFMTKSTITQSQKRFEESVGKLFTLSDSNLHQCVFITSSTDIGVVRNGGRNGARLAPQAFLSTLKKFTLVEKLMNYRFINTEVSNPKEEEKDFKHAQKQEAERITEVIQSNPSSTFIHIGGGHDHIYPLMRALSDTFQKLVVINIDAHADTRTDPENHSGTPFRQFGDEFPGKLKLFQIGLNSFANSFSTLEPIGETKMNVLWINQLNPENLKNLFHTIQAEIDEATAVIFSLDTDALNGGIMPGVSAVNPLGLNLPQLCEIWGYYKNLKISHRPIVGIYELNPVYDTLAGLSMRTIGSFVFELL
jgi:formiminoglutamase